MKRNRLISLALIIVMLVSVMPFAAAPALAASAPSPWAVPEMNEANVKGLLTPSAARNYQKELTRDEFCEIVVKLVETIRGKALPLPAANPFTDTNSIYILKAYEYGITNGTSNTLFSPNEKVTRQMICTMMYRAIAEGLKPGLGLEKELGRTLLSPPAATLDGFIDAASIADYAVVPIRYAVANSIILGDELHRIYPKGNITAEQCVAIAIRSFTQMDSVLSQYRTTVQNLDFTQSCLTIGYAFGDTAYGVTQNIVLPTSGSGGAVITWTSSNDNIISIGSVLYGADSVTQIGRVGVVTAGSAQSVTLTATITLGGQTRTQTFTLRNSLLTGDQLLYENAYNLLDIIYLTDGDSATSVSGRIGLVNKVLDLPVIWSSNNPQVVTNTGMVYPPTGSEIRYATLTATIGSGPSARTKTFDLTVVNATAGRGVSLNGVELGATSARVTQVLGTVTKTIAASTTESWQLYYSSNYGNFIAVAFVNSRVVAVFSMASTVANQLKDAAGTVISVDQANAASGVSAVSYSDGTQYAIMIYETSSTIGSQRSLTVDKQEELLFELVNAYRAKNSRSALELTSKLGTIARAHSTWNIGSAPSVGTSTNALSYKAEAAGFYTTGNQPRYTGGNVLSGQNDAFGFLRELVNNATMRGEILDNTSTLFGAGFAASTAGTGSYGNYMTYMLASVKFITNVTTTAATGTTATISIPGTGVGSAISVPLAITYTSLLSSNDYIESYTVTSSNTARFTVAYLSGATYTITGVTTGDANLIITGNLSGKVFEIPVNVGAVYATALSVTYPATSTTLIASTGISTLGGLYTIVAVAGEQVSLSATATPAATGTAPAVSWSCVGVTPATYPGNTYNFTVPTATIAGTTLQVQASVPASSGANITHTIYVIVVPAATVSVLPLSASIGTGTVKGTSSVGTPTGVTLQHTWSSSDPTVLAVVTPAAAITDFNGLKAGVSTVTYTAAWSGTISGSGSYLGRLTKTFNITVTGAAYATTLTLSKPNLIGLLVSGAQKTITATYTPTGVTNNTISWSSNDTSSVDVSSATGNTINLIPGGGAGLATITASMATANPLVFLEKTVPVVVVNSIIINEGHHNITKGTSEPLTLNYDPTTLGLTVSWASSNEDVAYITSSGTLIAVDTGAPASITVSVFDGNGDLVTSYSINVTVDP